MGMCCSELGTRVKHHNGPAVAERGPPHPRLISDTGLSGKRHRGLGGNTSARVEEENRKIGFVMIVVGLILLIIGLLVGLSLLTTIGGILILVGAILWILGATGRAVGGRKHYF